MKVRWGCVVCAVVAAAAGSARGNLIVNPDFEPITRLEKRGYFHRPVHGTGQPLPGWTAGGGLDVGSAKHWEVPDGTGRAVDLIGSPGRGGLSQTITGLTAGETYTLTFDLAANPARGRHEGKTTKGLEVTLTGSDETEPTAFSVVSPQGARKKSMGYQTETISFVAASDWVTVTLKALAPLSLRGKPYRGAYAGPVVANLDLEGVSSGTPREPIPEPGTLALAAGGAAGLLLRRRARG